MAQLRGLPAEQLQQLSPRDIIRAGIEYERLETISLGRINREPELADGIHATELGKSMRNKRGQISPITVRATMAGADIRYDIVDGFHRVEGKWKNLDSGMTAEDLANSDVKANVHYGMSDAELLDYRVTAVGSIKSVQFPRIASWVTASYNMTEFAEQGLTVLDAFGIAVSKSSSPRVQGYTSDKVAEIKDWVIAKCERWEKKPANILEVLKIVDGADPTLVLQVRDIAGVQGTEEFFTRTQLRHVVSMFAGEDHYASQRGVMRAVRQRRLTGQQVKLLVARITPAIHKGIQEDTAYSLAMAVPPASISTQEYRLRPGVVHSDGPIGHVDVPEARTRTSLAPEGTILDAMEIERLRKETLSLRGELGLSAAFNLSLLDQLASTQHRLAIAAEQGGSRIPDDARTVQERLAAAERELELYRHRDRELFTRDTGTLSAEELQMRLTRLERRLRRGTTPPPQEGS
jgi:hypothetical protein